MNNEEFLNLLFCDFIQLRGGGSQAKAPAGVTAICKYGKKWKLLDNTKLSSYKSFGGVLREPFVCVDIDTENEARALLNIIKTLNLNAPALKTTRGIHFYFCYPNGKQLKNDNHIITRIALEVDFKTNHDGVGSYLVLKLNGVERSFIWGNVSKPIAPLPSFLYPFFQNKRKDAPQKIFRDIYPLEAQTEEARKFFIKLWGKYLKKSPTTTPAEAEEALNIINSMIFPSPLPQAIINEELTKKTEEAPARVTTPREAKNIDFLKSQLRDYCEHHLQKSKGNYFECPLCGSGTRENGTGAFSINESTGGESWKCFACGEGGDIFNLYEKINNCDFKTAKHDLEAEYNLTPEPLKTRQHRPQSAQNATLEPTSNKDGEATPEPLNVVSYRLGREPSKAEKKQQILGRIAKELSKNLHIILRKEATGERLYFWTGKHYEILTTLELERRVRYEINKIQEEEPTFLINTNDFNSFVIKPIIQSLKPKEQEEKEKYQFYISCDNCILEINPKTESNEKTYIKTHPHTPEIFVRIKINATYDPTKYGEPGIVDSFLNDIANNDPATRALLEEIIGYSLFPNNKLRKIFYFVGDGGNGKSTFLNLLASLVGKENVSNSTPKSLEERPFETANLYNKLLNTCDDLSPKQQADYFGKIKTIASGDLLQAEIKGGACFSFFPFCKMIFCQNEPPIFKEQSDAIQSRVVLIPFNNCFLNTKKNPRDPFFSQKIDTKDTRARLLILGLEALQRLLDNNNFTSPKAVARLTEENKRASDPIYSFLLDFEIKGDSLSGRSVRFIFDLYQRYKETSRILYDYTTIQTFPGKVKKYYRNISTVKNPTDHLKYFFWEGDKNSLCEELETSDEAPIKDSAPTPLPSVEEPTEPTLEPAPESLDNNVVMPTPAGDRLPPTFDYDYLEASSNNNKTDEEAEPAEKTKYKIKLKKPLKTKRPAIVLVKGKNEEPPTEPDPGIFAKDLNYYFLGVVDGRMTNGESFQSLYEKIRQYSLNYNKGRFFDFWKDEAEAEAEETGLKYTYGFLEELSVLIKEKALQIAKETSAERSAEDLSLNKRVEKAPKEKRADLKKKLQKELRGDRTERDKRFFNEYFQEEIKRGAPRRVDYLDLISTFKNFDRDLSIYMGKGRTYFPLLPLTSFLKITKEVKDKLPSEAKSAGYLVLFLYFMQNKDKQQLVDIRERRLAGQNIVIVGGFETNEVTEHARRLIENPLSIDY